MIVVSCPIWNKLVNWTDRVPALILIFKNRKSFINFKTITKFVIYENNSAKSCYPSIPDNCNIQHIKCGNCTFYIEYYRYLYVFSKLEW